MNFPVPSPGSSGLLLSAEKVDHALQHLSFAVKEAIPGTLGAGVSILDSQARPLSTGFTDSIVEQADALQYELGEGPCLTAWASEQPVLVRDAGTDPRWPSWSAAVRTLPVRSVISTPLIADGHSIGAMKIYAAQPGLYDHASTTLMGLFATPAATLLSHIQTAEIPERISQGLQTALHSRDLINRACGILIERHQLGPDQALQQLMRHAREQRRTLRETSAALIAETTAGNPADPA